MKTSIIKLARMNFKDPILIIGLPGIGNVGSIVSEHIRVGLNAKPFARIYSPYFPPIAKINEDGELELISDTFYYAKVNGRDLLILSGDSQILQDNKQAYDFSEMIVKFFKSYKGKRIYAIGGYGIADHYIENPKVFGAVNNKKLRKELDSIGINAITTPITIFGVLGLIPSIARSYGIDAICLMGESGFVDIDVNAAKAVINVLEKIFGFSIDLNDLDKVKQEIERMLKDMTAMKPKEPDQSYIR